MVSRPLLSRLSPALRQLRLGGSWKQNMVPRTVARLSPRQVPGSKRWRGMLQRGGGTSAEGGGKARKVGRRVTGIQDWRGLRRLRDPFIPVPAGWPAPARCSG